MNQDQPVRPANILNIVAINQGKKPLTMDEPRISSLTASQAAKLINQDCMLIDTRSPEAFGVKHIPQSYNIPLDSHEFEQRVGWITPLEAPLILLLDEDIDNKRAMHALVFIGLDHRVKGFITGGISAWTEAKLPLKSLNQLDVKQLYTNLQTNSPMHVLDVRETSEWDSGHIQGATHQNYKFLAQQFDQFPLSLDDSIAVICEGGLRSSVACSILLRHGFKNIYNIVGGMSAWAANNLPMVDAQGCVVSLPHVAKPEWFEL